MDQAVEQNRSQIADALERAEAQRNAKAGLAGGEAAQANRVRAREAEAFYTADGRLVRRAPPPKQWLADCAKFNISRWSAAREGTPDIGGAARAKAALDVLDDAIRCLGTRDRNGTAAWLRDTRTAIASALSAYEGFGAEIDGKIALDLIAKITACRTELESARATMHAANKSTVAAARAALDIAEAGERELGREIVQRLAEMKWIDLPDLAMFLRAKQKTEELARRAGKKPTAAAQHAALDEGRDATAAEAKIWICFEAETPHALLALRWARHVGE